MCRRRFPIIIDKEKEVDSSNDCFLVRPELHEEFKRLETKFYKCVVVHLNCATVSTADPVLRPIRKSLLSASDVAAKGSHGERDKAGISGQQALVRRRGSPGFDVCMGREQTYSTVASLGLISSGK
jgi:hypothetical protein